MSIADAGSELEKKRKNLLAQATKLQEEIDLIQKEERRIADLRVNNHMRLEEMYGHRIPRESHLDKRLRQVTKPRRLPTGPFFHRQHKMWQLAVHEKIIDHTRAVSEKGHLKHNLFHPNVFRVLAEDIID
jgi:hypothetical protein